MQWDMAVIKTPNGEKRGIAPLTFPPKSMPLKNQCS